MVPNNFAARKIVAEWRSKENVVSRQTYATMRFFFFFFQLKTKKKNPAGIGIASNLKINLGRIDMFIISSN